MPEPASRIRMPLLVGSKISMHGVLQPWMIPSGTDQGTDPRTPRNLTRIDLDAPCDAFFRRLAAPRELSQQLLGPFRPPREPVPLVVFVPPPQLRIGRRQHGGRPRLVQQQA